MQCDGDQLLGSTDLLVALRLGAGRLRQHASIVQHQYAVGLLAPNDQWKFIMLGNTIYKPAVRFGVDISRSAYWCNMWELISPLPLHERVHFNRGNVMWTHDSCCKMQTILLQVTAVVMPLRCAGKIVCDECVSVRTCVHNTAQPVTSCLASCRRQPTPADANGTGPGVWRGTAPRRLRQCRSLNLSHLVMRMLTRRLRHSPAVFCGGRQLIMLAAHSGSPGAAGRMAAAGGGPRKDG